MYRRSLQHRLIVSFGWGLQQVHCSHAAEVMRVAQDFSSRSNKPDLSAVPDHPPALWFGEVLALNITIVIDTVVISAQRAEIQRVRLPTALMCIQVVHLSAGTPQSGHGHTRFSALANIRCLNDANRASYKFTGPAVGWNRPA